jgi:hypothetical protein
LKELPKSVPEALKKVAKISANIEGMPRRRSMRNLSFPPVLTHLTTRSLTAVYAEFTEVFEMTGKGLPIRILRLSLVQVP